MRALALACVAGCAQLIAPDVGPPLHATCTNTDSDPAHDTSYARDVAPLFEEYHCVKCHTPDGQTPLGYLVGGLDLSSYETLRTGGVRSGANVIVPGMPCTSVLLQKLGPAPPFGTRMPLDGPPYLDDEDLEALGNWIAEGAHDD